MTNPVVFVHGFRYDPRSPGPNHPEHETYPLWREMLGREDDVVPFEWFSHPSIANAWRHKRWNRYRRAWDLAEEASAFLAHTLTDYEQPIDIVCHSLGSRVTMLALHRWHGRAARVLILNGAEYSTTGRDTAMLCPTVRFYNVVVREDDVLNKLAQFAPGRDTRFLGNYGAPTTRNWQNFDLDLDPLLGVWATEHDLPRPVGDNPKGYGDHKYTFENPDNWLLYRHILSGQWDDWLSRGVKGTKP